MPKDSLHHLERQHLRRVKAEGLQLPGVCLHHYTGSLCATELCPANTIQTPYLACSPPMLFTTCSLQISMQSDGTGLCKDGMHAEIPLKTEN